MGGGQEYFTEEVTSTMAECMCGGGRGQGGGESGMGEGKREEVILMQEEQNILRSRQ